MMKALGLKLLAYLAALEDYFHVPKGSTGRQARIALYFLLAGGFNFFTYLPIFTLLRNWIVLAGLCIGTLSCWYGMFLIKRGKVSEAAWLAVIGSYVALSFNSIFLGGVFSLNDLFIIPVFMVAWLLFGRSIGIKLALLLALSTLLLFGVYLNFGAIFSLPMEEGGIGHAAMTTAFKISLIYIIFALIFVFDYFMSEALQVAEKLNATMSAILSSEITTGLAIFDESLKLLPGSTSAYFDKNVKAHDLVTMLDDFETENKSVVVAAIQSLMGEDTISWDLNSGNLPHSVSIKGQRHYVQWLPIVVQDRVKGIIFSAQNIENLLNAQAEAERKNKEALALAHLVSLGPAKVCNFIERAKFHISEAKRYYLTGEMRHVFIALHTLKGSARGMGFMDLAEKLHNIESHIKHIEEKEFAEVNSVLSTIEEASKSLGYSPELLQVSRREARDALAKKNAEEFLLDLTHPTIESMVESFVADLEKMARKLGKKAPTLKITSDYQKTHISDEAKDAINVSFIHALRNALDHGIEMPEERKAQGKPDTPLIEVHLIRDDRYLQIVVSDDGRGLNLDQIKAHALSKGIGRQAERREDIANLIFMPGFSTRREVTDLSGRGVGMDAIKTFMEELGGGAYITLLGPGSVTPFQLILSLPLKHLLQEASFRPKSVA